MRSETAATDEIPPFAHAMGAVAPVGYARRIFAANRRTDAEARGWRVFSGTGARRTRERGGERTGGGAGGGGVAMDGCPVAALGHRAGFFLFRDASGQVQSLSARQLGGGFHLMALFLGDLSWPRARFPARTPLGVRTDAAADFLMRMAGDAGLLASDPTLRSARKGARQ